MSLSSASSVLLSLGAFPAASRPMPTMVLARPHGLAENTDRDVEYAVITTPRGGRLGRLRRRKKLSLSSASSVLLSLGAFSAASRPMPTMVLARPHGLAENTDREVEHAVTTTLRDRRLGRLRLRKKLSPSSVSSVLLGLRAFFAASRPMPTMALARPHGLAENTDREVEHAVTTTLRDRRLGRLRLRKKLSPSSVSSVLLGLRAFFAASRPMPTMALARPHRSAENTDRQVKHDVMRMPLE